MLDLKQRKIDMLSVNKNSPKLISSISVTEDGLIQLVFDGWEHRLLYPQSTKFERLVRASVQQLKNNRLIANGTGIQFVDIDEDLSAEGLFELSTPADSGPAEFAWHTWPEHIRKLFDYSESAIGNGEFATAALVCGITPDSIAKFGLDSTIAQLRASVTDHSETYDVLVKRDAVSAAIAAGYASDRIVFPSLVGKKIEVKKPTGGKVRAGADGMISVMEQYAFFRRLAADIARAFKNMSEVLELLTTPNTYEKLAQFVTNDVTMIERGEMSQGRVFGKDLKGSKQDFGLMQVVKTFACIKKAKLLRDDWRAHISFGGTAICIEAQLREAVGVLRQFFVGDALESSITALGLTPLEADILVNLDNPCFDNPSLISDAWTRLSPAHKTFSSADIVCLANSEAYMLIPAGDSDRVLELSSISQGGRPCYKIRNEFINEPSA